MFNFTKKSLFYLLFGGEASKKDRNGIFLVLFLVLVCCLLVVVFPIGANADSVSVPTNTGLIGYWKLDEGTGTKIMDYSGKNNNGILSGSASWASGKLGKALNFNGSSNYIDTPSSSVFSFGTGDFTLSIWIKPSSFAGYNHMIAYDGSQNVAALKTNITNGAIYYYSPTFTTDPTISANLQLGVWNHVILVRRSNVAEIYLNGVLKGTKSAFNDNFTGSHFLRFGNGWTGEYTNGLMDDIRIYNRALSTSEIRTLYLSGSALLKTVNKTGLIGYWPLDEGTSTIAHDMSGNLKHGVFSGSPTWTTGKLGKALSFVGNSIVDLGNSMAGTLPAMTISAWVKPSSYGTWRAIVQTSTTGDKALYLQSAALQFYSSCNSSGTVPLNQWTHVVATVSSGEVITYYINGVASGGCTSVNSPRVVEYLHISGTGIADGENFQGLIDDVRVYNRVLSATEVLDMYRSGSSAINAGKNDFLTSGLVGLWTFNGGDINWATNTAYDRSGQGNNGTITGMNKALSILPGKIGQALKFNGVSSGTYVNLGTSATLTPANFTVSAWANAGPGTYGAGYGYIYSNARDCCTAGQNGIDIQFTSGILYGGFWNGGSPAQTNSVTPVAQNSGWHHLVTTYNGSVLAVYVDGVFKNSVNTALGIGSPATYSTNIGSMGYSAGTYTFDGKIDDVRLYNRALSANEIKQLYNNGR